MSRGRVEKDGFTFCILFFSSVHERHYSVQVVLQRGDELIDETRRRAPEQVSNSASTVTGWPPVGYL